MGILGSYQYPTMESVIYGRPAAAACRAGAAGLAGRDAETFDGVPQHTTREVVVRVAKQAKDAKADLVVAIGGGSVVDAAKIVLMCMEHEIFEPAGVGGFWTPPRQGL